MYCAQETRVTNSRHQKKPNRTWRRRQCLACSAVFTTVEASDLEKSIAVEQNGTLQAFLRDKLFISVYESLKHRKTALSDATALTDTVIATIVKQANDGVIASATITASCIQILHRFDKTAAVYYVAYHPLN